MDETSSEVVSNWISLAFSTLVVICCVVGDNLLEQPLIRSHLWLRALGDSITHGIVGAFSWATVIMVAENLRTAPKWTEILLAGVMASSIDIDHFIAAKSLNLKVNF